MTPTFPPLREELRGIEPYGAPQLSREQAPVQLNVNENPYGPSPEVAADICRTVGEAAVSLNRYPDREFSELRHALDDSERRFAANIAETAVGRLGTEADVANAVAFLCAEESGFVTGVVVDVTGGSYMP